MGFAAVTVTVAFVVLIGKKKLANFSRNRNDCAIFLLRHLCLSPVRPPLFAADEAAAQNSAGPTMCTTIGLQTICGPQNVAEKCKGNPANCPIVNDERGPKFFAFVMPGDGRALVRIRFFRIPFAVK